MTALSLKRNTYASKAVFRQIASRPLLKHDPVGRAYSRGTGSRSVSDTQCLSSFRSIRDVIDSLFTVQSGDVYRYLRNHSELFCLLLRSRAEVYWLFGPSTTVVVRMESDLEGEYQPRLLVAIQTSLSAASALNLIDKLDENWWLSVSPDARSLMKIDVEYL